MSSTLKVETLLKVANAAIAHQDYWTPAQRAAMQYLTEELLSAAKAYKGFMYLDGWPCDDPTRVRYLG